MFAILAAAVIAQKGPETVSLEPVKGHGRVIVPVPAGYRVVSQTPTLILMSSGTVRLTVKWTPDKVDKAMFAAIQNSFKLMQKQGHLVGPVSIGRFQGQLLSFPLPKGLDLHAVMTSGKDLVSTSYFNSSLPKADYPKVTATFKSFIVSAHLVAK